MAKTQPPTSFFVSPVSIAPMPGGTRGAAGDSVLFEDMPAEEYHADRDALSCSLLKPLLISPAHFQAALTQCPSQSDAMDYGSLLHLLVLEPKQVCHQVAVYPEPGGRTKAFTKFERDNCGKLVFDEPTFATAQRLADKVRASTYKGREFQRFIEESLPEVTIYFTEPTTGLRMRVRVDLYHPEITFDLKTSRFGTARAFANDAVQKDYDLQAFMYSLARCLYEGSSAAKPFVFVVAETNAPHSINLLAAGEDFMSNGAHKFEACATTYKACSTSNFWPDLSSVDELVIEPWQRFDRRAGWRAALGTHPLSA